MAQRPFARIRMSALTSSHLAAYRDERLKVVSGATVNREFSVLSHAIDTARREWDVYMPTNPCTLVRRPRRDDRGTGGCRVMKKSGSSPLAAAPATNGSRIAWPLPSKQACGGGELLDYCGTTWTSSGARPSCCHQEWRVARRAALEPRGRSTSWPACTSNGRVFGELTPLALRLSFNRATRRAGITGLRLHDLRHEATSRFFEKGLNVMEVASVTGTSRRRERCWLMVQTHPHFYRRTHTK